MTIVPDSFAEPNGIAPPVFAKSVLGAFHLRLVGYDCAASVSVRRLSIRLAGSGPGFDRTCFAL